MTKSCLKKNLPSLLVLMLVITGMSYAQVINPPMGTSPWKFANPTPHAFSYSGISFIDNNNGIGVSPGGLGAAGGIMKSTDGGRNWQMTTYKYVTNTNGVAMGSFNDVQFVTANIAYAVGSAGLMIKSTDAGATWAQVTTPLTAFARNINALHFINKDTGYIGGASLTSGNTTNINDAPKVYFTRNGGSTWDSLATPFRPQQNNITLSGFNTAEIHRIHFLNDSVGYVSGSCGSAIANYSAILWKIKNNIVTDYSLHRSKFGITATTGSYTPATQTFKGLLGINDSLVLISSLNNNVVIRVKTGVNDSTANAVPAVFGAYERGVYEILIWLNSTATPFPASLVGNVSGQMPHIRKAPDGKIIITAGTSLIFSTDNGNNWTFSRPHAAGVLYPHWGFGALAVTNNGKIVVGSFNGLTYDSIPGATGWQTVYKNIKPLFFSFADMDWADCQNGITVGSNGSIATTSDGGQTWVDNSNTVFQAAQLSIMNVTYHATNSMFFTAGTNIYKSADQGTTNDAIFAESVANSTLYSYTMVGQDIAFATGYRFSPAVQRTVIFRSLNANSANPTWDTVKTFPAGTLAPQLRNIKFANQDTGYTSGSRGKVYRTIDGGNSWTDISPDTLVNSNGTATYTALSVVNGRTIFIGGSSKKLFKSTDAGSTWTDLTLATPATPSPLTAFSSITNIVMNDANNGYANAGNILLTTTDAWQTWSWDLSPQSLTNIKLYPKIAGPITGKKLYGLTTTAGTPVNSTQSANILEYGYASSYTTSSTETVTNASCTNPTAGSITINAVGGVTPYTFNINGGAFQPGNSFTGLAQGNYTINIKDNGCQTITKTITVGFTDNLTVTATPVDTMVCAGAPVQLNATSNNAATTYAWSPANGLSSTSIANPIATSNSNTTYTVTASLNGCTKTSTVKVNIKPNPVVSAGADKTIVEGASVLLDGAAPNATSVLWSPAATLTNANTFTPTAKPTTTTTYTITVRNSDGCTSTDDAVVTVIPYCVSVMNAFTPNGDGIHDLWRVTNGSACTNQVMVKVFNRYGAVVYENDNYQNNWDGKYKGKPVADGTYYYTIQYRLINGRTVPAKGDVTILR